MQTRVHIQRLLVWVFAWTFATAGGYSSTFEELARVAADARRGNRLPEAIELYRQALEVQPDWAEGWWFAGTLSYSLYRHAECETSFTHFVQLDDKRELAWALLGLCEFETGHYDSAQRHLQRGLSGGELPPEIEAGARFHYGLLLTKAGLFDRGSRELTRFARGGASEPMLIMGIGLNALRLPLLPTEIPAEQQDLIAKAGKVTCSWLIHPEALGAEIAATTVGAAGQAEKTFRELEDQFHDLVNSYPAAPGVHYLYGMYLGSSRPAQAQAEFRRELEVNPENADARAMIALAQLMHGDAADALIDAKKAAEKASDPVVEYAYGKALVATGLLAEGIARLETAERLDPAALTYRAALAGAYSKAGRYDDARQQRQAVLTMAEGQVGPN
jgi:tetratricopeptide (TPR) repeat protein